MKTWLKGGLIGILITIILTLLCYLRINCVFIDPFHQCEVITQCHGMNCMGCIVISPLLLLIELFIIGSIIGLIIQKLKK